MSKIYFKFNLLLAVLTAIVVDAQAQTGNMVFTGASVTNFGSISLSTPSGKLWMTDKLALPGYYSVTIGSVYTNPSDANHVNGYVKKYGNEIYSFPVGTGTDLRTLSITAPISASDSYATAWVLGDPSGNLDPTGPNSGPHDINARTLPINAVSKVGFWDWQNGIDMGTTGDGNGITVTVSIPDMSFFATTDGLRLVGWNGSNWVDLSGAPTASGTTENSTLTGTMIPGISAIGIGSVYFTLPLKLISFNVQERGCQAFLNWVTNNEQQVAVFEIEQSKDGISFEKISSVEAKNSTGQNNYSIVVTQILGTGYYRLKMIDKDGKFTYSPVETVTIKCPANNDFVKIYPDPVIGGFVMINFSSDRTGSARLVLTNSLGLRTREKTINITGSSNLVRFELEGIEKGVYFIQLLTPDQQPVFETQKIIIK